MSTLEAISLTLGPTLDNSDFVYSEIIEAELVGSIAYAACLTVDRISGAKNVVALVLIPELGEHMSEDEGPCFDHCPYSVLRALSPTKNPTAIDWRMRCWVNLKISRGIIPFCDEWE